MKLGTEFFKKAAEVTGKGKKEDPEFLDEAPDSGKEERPVDPDSLAVEAPSFDESRMAQDPESVKAEAAELRQQISEAKKRQQSGLARARAFLGKVAGRAGSISLEVYKPPKQAFDEMLKSAKAELASGGNDSGRIMKVISENYEGDLSSSEIKEVSKDMKRYLRAKLELQKEGLDPAKKEMLNASVNKIMGKY